MNPSLHFISFAIAFSSSLVFANEEGSLPENEATSARVIGEIPDGTPPPPQLSTPSFVVPAEDVLESKTHRQGGREITIQRIAPIELPPLVEAPSSKPNDPVVQERIEALRAKYSDSDILRIGATVYRSPDSPPR